MKNLEEKQQQQQLSVKQKIVEIANQLRINKSGTNTFSNYKYFEPDEILLRLNPLLKELELITIFSLINKGDYYEGILTIESTTNDERVTFQFDIDKAIVKGANAAQNSGATLTYAKRYSLMNAFNIADNKNDFDSNFYSENIKYISENQRKEIFKAANGNKELVLDIIKKYGYDNTTTILATDFEAILGAINARK